MFGVLPDVILWQQEFPPKIYNDSITRLKREESRHAKTGEEIFGRWLEDICWRHHYEDMSCLPDAL